MKSTPNRDKLNIYFISGIIFSLMTVVLAVMFISETADIYFSATGDTIYSREIVRGRLLRLIAPTAIWFVCAVLNYVFSIKFYTEKPIVRIDRRIILSNMRRRIKGYSEITYPEYKAFAIYDKIKIVCLSVATAFSVLSSVIVLVNLLNVSNFKSGNINADVVSFLAKILPFIAVSFLLFITTAVYDFFATKCQISLLKAVFSSLSKEGVKPQNTTVPNSNTNENKSIFIVRIAVLAVAVGFIIVGIVNGGVGETFAKAVAICTECIGLG